MPRVERIYGAIILLHIGGILVCAWTLTDHLSLWAIGAPIFFGGLIWLIILFVRWYIRDAGADDTTKGV